MAGSQIGSAQDPTSADPVAGQRIAQPCLSCHQLENFSRFDPAELLTAITAITAGERGHIPLPLSLTEQDIVNIAAFISEANARTD